MNDSPRSGSLFCAVITLLGITLVLLLFGTQGFAQPQEDHPSWLRALDSLSTERMLADVRTLSGPALNGRQAGSEDDLRSAQWFAQELTSAGVTLPLIYNTPLTFTISQPRKGRTRRRHGLDGHHPAHCAEPHPSHRHSRYVYHSAIRRRTTSPSLIPHRPTSKVKSFSSAMALSILPKGSTITTEST